jgi:hypothetical protein
MRKDSFPLASFGLFAIGVAGIGDHRYLDELESADAQDEVVLDPSAVAAALEKLKKHSEPEAGFMRTGDGTAPAYNVQTAVDAEHALMVVPKVTRESNDTRSLQPMAEAAKWPWASLRG